MQYLSRTNICMTVPFHYYSNMWSHEWFVRSRSPLVVVKQHNEELLKLILLLPTCVLHKTLPFPSCVALVLATPHAPAPVTCHLQHASRLGDRHMVVFLGDRELCRGGVPAPSPPAQGSSLALDGSSAQGNCEVRTDDTVFALVRLPVTIGDEYWTAPQTRSGEVAGYGT